MIGSIERLLEILLIPVVGFVIIDRCLGGTRTGIDADPLLITATVIYSVVFLLRGSAHWRRNWLDWALLLVVVVETVSYLTSTYPPNSLHHYHEILFLFLFYCFVRLHLRHEYQRLAIFLLVTLFGLYLSVTALTAFSRQHAVITGLGFPDVSGLKQFVNLLQKPGTPLGEWVTIYLMLLPFPILLFLRWADRTAGAWLLLCPAVTLLLTIAATFSRGLYIATAAFFAAALLLFRLYKLAALKRLVRFSLCALVLSAAVLAVTPLARPVLTAASMFSTTSQVRSVEGRAGLWRESWEVVRDYPLFGVGSFNFPMQYAAYKGEDSAYVGRTFNIVLQLLVEKGVLGLLAYCLLFFSFFKVSHDNVRLLRDAPFRKAAVVLGVATCLALLVRDLSYTSMLTNEGVAVLLWLIFAHNALSQPSSAESAADAPADA